MNLQAVRVQHSLHFSLSLTVSEITANLYWPIRKQQIENFKICNFTCSNPVRIGNSLHFALSLTVSEISANLIFLKFLKCSKMFCCDHLQHLWSPNFVRFALSLMVLSFKFKFKNRFFLKWPPFGQFLTRFLPKTNQHQFSVYWLFLQNFKSFHLAFRPVPTPQDFFKLLNF